MTHRDDVTRMRHMLEHAREAVQLASGRTRADLDADRTFNLAMTRLLEIIGEAAARVSESARQRHPQIRWLAIAGMRHRLIHGYDSVDFDILWNVVQVDLPPLIGELTSILAPP
jgi:uncharacterized protein with HEPN domain